MKYLLLLFALPFYGQILHHQMLSSQGLTKKISNGFTISQTIGQQSAVGNSTKETIIIQGFQQNLWSSYISSNINSNIIVTTFPNPFTDVVNFKFSKIINGEIAVYFFNISGHLVHNYKSEMNNTVVSIDLSKVPTSEYLVQIRTSELTYYTKIIKI